MRSLFVFVFFTFIYSLCYRPACGQIINTVAGGPGAGLATKLSMQPNSVAISSSGDMYLVDYNFHVVRKINAQGKSSVIAGTGTLGYSGDGGDATAANLAPHAVAIDAAGNVYISDQVNNRIRKVNTSGIITTVVGNGVAGYGGDGGAAIAAQLNSPCGISVDPSGNLYIADAFNYRIRKVNTSGIISTVAGNGTSGYSGDGGMATAAKLVEPTAVATDAAGNIFIVDGLINRIRKVNTSGIINTVAGNGIGGYNGDGMVATAAQLNSPAGCAVDGSGNLYIADYGNSRVRKVNTSGILSTVAGNGGAGDTGDGGAATLAEIGDPVGIAVDVYGNLYMASGVKVRKVNNTGTISTVAANGSSGFGGDLAPATSAQIKANTGVAVDASGNVYIADLNNQRVRKVSSGIITTIAGTGTQGYGGDGGGATAAKLYNPCAVAVDASGNVFIADNMNKRVRKVNTAGVISTIAGNGTYGNGGDGGAATAAQLYSPYGVAVDGAGNVYIADRGNNNIRKVNAAGIISTFAGNGTAGFSGDGGSAVAAQLKNPTAVAVDASGNVYIADENNNRVRKVNTSGIISTIAGNGTPGFSGDGGAGTSCQLNTPCGVAVDASGNVYITDRANNRIRKVDATGVITTITGNGLAGYNGDGINAAVAQINNPMGIATDALGDVYISDYGNDRIRKICNSFVVPAISIAPNQNNVCTGTIVMFTAPTVNQGPFPDWQWKVNGINTGNVGAYSFTPNNGDVVSCVLTSNEACVSPVKVTSNSITMIVTPQLIPVVNVTVNPGAAASAGQQIAFIANVTNAGANPLYQWRKNGVNISGATQNSYIAVAGTDLQNNDKISVWVKNTQSCGDSAVSNAYTVAITTSIADVGGNNSITLYPNPNKGSFNVNGVLVNKTQHNVILEVYNAIGQSIYKKEVGVTNGMLDHNILLPQSLFSGNYYLKVNDGGNSVIRFTVVNN